jgi:hypothetical protein
MARFIIGALALLIAAFLTVSAIGGAVAAFWPDAPRIPVLFFFVPAFLFLVLTAYLWTRAIRATEEDDLFSGRRGLLISAMIVTTLAIVGTVLVFSLQIDFWRGLVDGARQAGR